MFPNRVPMSNNTPSTEPLVYFSFIHSFIHVCLPESPKWMHMSTKHWWNMMGKTEALSEKFVPLSLCPPIIQHKLAWNWTQASTVTSHHLTTWCRAQHHNRWRTIIFIRKTLLVSYSAHHGVCTSATWWKISQWVFTKLCYTFEA
jgi:hypothetical protein